jgi:abortive infection bacteriophage resistance protein
MKYNKPALSYEDQLNLLVSRKLTCSDRARALEWLKRIGYYRLSAYFIPFRTIGSDDFLAGTTLDSVVDLYKFDGNLRLLVMQAMDRIEVAVRGSITHHMAHTLGPFGYADANNFDPTYKHAELLRTIAREEKRSAELFVDHYRGKYTSEPHLPIWMATELVSFGALSMMYANLRTKL